VWTGGVGVLGTSQKHVYFWMNVVCEVDLYPYLYVCAVYRVRSSRRRRSRRRA